MEMDSQVIEEHLTLKAYRVEWLDFKGKEHRTKVMAHSTQEAHEWITDNRVTCAKILTTYRQKEDYNGKIKKRKGSTSKRLWNTGIKRFK